MVDVCDIIKVLLKCKQVNTDNNVFRLHYKFTVILLLLFSFLVTSKQYFGDPIDCVSGSQQDKYVMDTYCWIFSTFTIKSHLHEKDVSIWVPIYALHHDPKYFPDPEKFDPERFSNENKHNIVPFSYLPFGSGPRNCIASRFALLEIKTLFVHLLSKLEFTVIEKTQIPIKIGKNNFNMSTEKGTWLGMKPRSTS